MMEAYIAALVAKALVSIILTIHVPISVVQIIYHEQNVQLSDIVSSGTGLLLAASW